jgi:phosphatidate cytidylyltransferase
VGDLWKRLLSALVLGPLVVALFVFLPPDAFFVFLGLIFVLAAYELVRMAHSAYMSVVVGLSTASLLPLYLGRPEMYLLWLLFSPALYLLFRLVTPGSRAPSVNNELGAAVAVLLIGQVFLSFPLFSLYRLKEFGRYCPLLLLLVIWASDTTAYLVGKTFGRHRLAPLISPKKTIEGLLGAITGAILVAVLFKGQLGLTVPWAVATGLAIGVLGQLGDMLESISKRMWDVKDSSSLIPGHGGILDRIDSIMLTAPFLYYWLSGLRG